MIVGRFGKTVSCLAFRVSNIKPTAFERALKNLKTINVSPVTLNTGQRNQNIIKEENKQQIIQTLQQEGKQQNIDPLSQIKAEDVIIEYEVKQPSSLTKIKNYFANRNNSIPEEHHTAEQVIANVHQMTKQRLIKSGEAPILKRIKAQQSSDLRILHQKNIGLNLFLNRVYFTTGSSILMALGTIHFASSIPFLVMNPLMCIGYGTLMTAIGMYGAYNIKPHIIVEQQQGYQHIKTRNGVLRTSLFSLGWVGLGLFSMPFFNMLSSLMPMLIPNLIGMTIGCFGGASLLIASMPRFPMFSYGGLLGGLLGSLLSMRIINSFNEMVYGEHFISNFMQAVDMYGGTLVFSFFIFYNTMRAKQAYKQGNSDHLEISIKFYYDIWKFLRQAFYFIFKKKFD